MYCRRAGEPLAPADLDDPTIIPITREIPGPELVKQIRPDGGIAYLFDGLRAVGIDVSGLKVSANAHLIMPYHIILDHSGEAKLGKQEIGTTKRGIGPCYADKAARLGIRVQDMLDEKILKKKITAALVPKQLMLRPYEKDKRFAEMLDLQKMTEDLLTFGHRLEQHIADTSALIWRTLDDGKLALFEGAQATMLDIDHGTYPFVTSSNPVAGAATIGAGVGVHDIDEVWGVAKAYATRVGAGPFPTELFDETGDLLRANGHEFGTTTGRPRRCGWIDLVALRYAARLNTLDVLTGLESIKVATEYRGADDATFATFPYHQSVLHRARGVYEELPGWTEDITECRAEADLPQAARDYLAFLQEKTGVPIVQVGVGPGREQQIWTQAGQAATKLREHVTA